MSRLEQLKQWVKQSHNPLAGIINKSFKAIKLIEIPAVSMVYVPTRIAYTVITHYLSNISRILFWTPMFKTQLKQVGKHLYLSRSMPHLQGRLSIEIGDHCHLSGETYFSGRKEGYPVAQLILGNNVEIASQTNLAVGIKIILGNNVKVSNNCFLSGFSELTFGAHVRGQERAELICQAGNIILEEDVWLGPGVTVMQGVTIGKGTIVIAGSVVTKSLPENVIASGVPAKIIRQINVNQTVTSRIKDNHGANRVSQKVTSIHAGDKK